MKIIFLCEDSRTDEIREKVNGVLNPNECSGEEHYPAGRLKHNLRNCDELISIIDEKKYDSIVSDVDSLWAATRALYQSASAKRLFVVGTDNKWCPEKNETKVVEKMWNNIAKGSGEDLDPIKQTGWVDSFTKTFFSENEMKEWSDNTKNKLESYIHGDEKVVEIGIASGLTCFQIAPKVRNYIGIDLSTETLEKTRRTLEEKAISNVTLVQGEAIDIDKLSINGGDIFILNSVCQYFPGYNYFVSVIDKILRLMKPGGIIFLGDIPDADLLSDFRDEVKRRGGKANVRDLWYPKGLIQELPAIFSCISEVIISSKIGLFENELNKYRYDVIIRCGEGNKNAKRTKFQYALIDNRVFEEARIYGDYELLCLA